MAKKNNQIKKTVKDSAKSNKNNPIFKIVIIVLIFAFAIFMIINNFFPGKKNDNEFMFKKDGVLTFSDSTGNTMAKIDIQIANTDFDRQLGLMFRKSMSENQGMLFIFPQESVQSFWMRNTYISLDMIFVNADKKIVTIHKNTKTLSDQSYRSTGPAKYVIEVDAGFSDKFNIKVGDKINWVNT
ncbi:MAG: DUF192 domain-containing protein [Ignavibacteriaceae bacterium]